MRRVVVTGLGIISPIGNSAAEVTAALGAGRSGVERSEQMAEYGFRSQVAGTLKIDPADSSLFASAVPRLRKALRAGDEIVRLEAAVALGDIGPDAKPALPILELVAEDDPLSSVREAAEQAIAKISAANATPASP